MPGLRPSPSTYAILTTLAAVLTGACGGPAGPSSAPGAVLTAVSQSEHYTYHASPGDTVDAARQEAFHAWAVAALGVDPPRIDDFKYRDRAQMQQVTGMAANGWADPAAFAVHSIWSWENHEVVHVFTALIGRPSDFFNEGIAVALSISPYDGVYEAQWLGQPVHVWTRQYLAAGTLPAVVGIVETNAFRALDDTRSYAIAGSFMRFLVDSEGMAKTLQFFSGGASGDSAAQSDGRFRSAFGMSIDEADARWRGFLRQ